MFGLSSLLQSEIKKRGWTMKDLASRSGVSPAALSKLSNNPDQMPDLRTLSALSTALELPMRRLVEACGIPVEGDPSDEEERTKALIVSVPELQDLLSMLRELTPDDRASVLAHTEFLVHRHRARQ